ncbi:MAG: hypothetical protein ABNH26_12680 [Celeribacter sp.]|jgi:hypothetical protein
MKTLGESDDPKGLIHEAYRIDGISAAECRSIFMDWALSIEGAAQPALRRLLARYGQIDPRHPMTAVLQEGLGTSDPAPGQRRGGWRGRRGLT